MKNKNYKLDIGNIYSTFILNEITNSNYSDLNSDKDTEYDNPLAADYEMSIEKMNEKFPWIENLTNSKNLMNNALYDADTDTLSYSVAFMADYVGKSKAINIAQQVFPKLKKGMDFYTHGSNFEKLTKSTKIMMDAIGEKLRSYGVSIENVQTGYWDLVLTIKNASSESPNKLINAFELFYKAVAYLNNEDPDEYSEEI
jgi:hypothetical protein